MFTSAHLVARLQQSRLKRAGKRGIAIWERDYERSYGSSNYGSAKEARHIVESEPFSDRLSYRLIYEAGSEYMRRRGCGILAARRVERFEETTLARIMEPGHSLDTEDLKNLSLRLSLYLGCVTAPAFARVNRYHCAVHLVRSLVARLSNNEHRDVLGAQAEREGLKYLLLGPAISGLVYWFPSNEGVCNHG